jgi:tetratricopeptide (TPR) repeat protein
MTLDFLRIFAFGACLFLVGCSADEGSSDMNEVPIFTDFNTALKAGNRFLEEDRTEKAVKAYIQATELDPKNPEGFFQLGIALAERERVRDEESRISVTPRPSNSSEREINSREVFEKSVLLYGEVTRKSPQDHESFFNLGRALNRLDRDSDAEKAYREALRIAPEINEYRVKLGETLMKLAKWGEAVVVLRKAAEIDPDNFDLSEKIESAELGRKRLSFAPTPSPTPTVEGAED